jgi:histidinol-phosphate phosphatase family domain/HAD-superfamily hydrolase, subfamily IIIA
VRYLFIDRDGVINKDPGGWTEYSYVTQWSDFHFIPGSLEALKILKEKGIKVILISNQGGISKGYFSEDKLGEINSLMLKEIEKAGGAIEESFYCIHKDDDKCGCRKPKPGMLESAARKYGVDPKLTYFIGDAKTDVMAARNARCRSILVLSGKCGREDVEVWDEKPDHIFENLLETVKWLTNFKEKR